MVLVPYDSGHRGTRMGAGPEHLLRHGVASAVRAAGHDVSAEFVEAAEGFTTEAGTSFELYREVAGRVRAAGESGSLPVVLSGNCGASLGTVAGLRAANPNAAGPGVVWFDAHGDLNTPETSPSGFLDGMCLATLTGRCWRPLAAAVPGFTPTPDADVVLVGARDLDPPERAVIDGSAMRHLSLEALRSGGIEETLGADLDRMAVRLPGIYLHLDFDVLDATRWRANQFAPPGGLTRAELMDTLRAIVARVPVLAVGIAAYDPSYDERGELRETVLEALELVVR